MVSNFTARIYIFGFILALSACAPNLKHHSVETYKLANGLTIILYEDHTQSKVFGTVVCKTGSKNDPADATGLAHYQEHMLFKGTSEIGTTNWASEKPYIDSIFIFYDKLGLTRDDSSRKEIQKKINQLSIKASEFTIPNEISNLIKNMGGSDMNASTGPDITVFYNSFPPSQMARWLDLYSHRFLNPVFRSFQAELEVVYEEKNMYLDNFFSVLFENFQKNYFKVHPYGQPSLGTIEHLKNPSLTKMYNFFTSYYVPNNMALILVGNFSASEVKSLIDKNFGIWRQGMVPSQKVYAEKPFKGREFAEGNYSPFNIALLGFRTVPPGHEDEIPLEIFNGILSNSENTGLLDKLVLNNKLLSAQIISLPYDELGGSAIVAIPKVSASLGDAEKLIIEEIRKVRKGNFNDSLFQSILLEKYRNFELNLESLEETSLLLAHTFGRGENLMQAFSYPSRIKMVTKADIVKVANKYFGDNYLAFYSNVGNQHPGKIDKPDYKPVIINTSSKSRYARHFDSIAILAYAPAVINFDSDVITRTIKNHGNLYVVRNPVNDIFSLKLKYGAGYKKFKTLMYGAELMNYAEISENPSGSVKDELGYLGCTYEVSCDDSYVEILLTGPESNFSNALSLLNSLLLRPTVSPEKLGIIYDRTIAERKLERSGPDYVADALLEFVKYGKKSKYIDRLTLEEIRNLNIDSLISEFKKSMSYELQIHYTGQKNADELAGLISQHFSLKNEYLETESPFVEPLIEYNSNSIFLTDKKDAVQSKVYFFSNGKNYDMIDDAAIEGFNLYFGGDFSGLALQEIREYRSMAYQVMAQINIPATKGKPCWFTGYVGTQSDKTSDAVLAFIDLFRNMPSKQERMNMVRPYLIQSAIAGKPTFRNISESVLNWQLRGYKQDPVSINLKRYESLNFNSIEDYYTHNIQNRPLIISIVGEKKRMSLEKLSKYSKIIEIKEKDLYRD